MKIVIVTGGFDPVHSGHISYLNHAEHLGDWLIVGLNSDAWLERKKGRAFMNWHERMTILDNLHMVDRVISFNDDDGSSIDAIRQVKQMFPNDQIIFANGGDRTSDNIPEMVFDDVEFVFGVGGDDKKNSSSWILENWKAPKTPRTWGYYRVLHENGEQVKVKELTVDPGKSLSMQKHKDRAEIWFIAEGTATLYDIDERTTDVELRATYKQFQTLFISRDQWHQLANESTEPLKIIEVQYGDRCVEEDIERK
jgi:D-beta-D-heptose 7-phosphate kinase/D-beta-D-heptose 1-phosphate adenosyltransferase